MKIEFHKRTKKQSQGEPIAEIPVDETQTTPDLKDRPKKVQFQPFGRNLDKTKTNAPSSVHSNTLFKKFEPQKVGMQDLGHVVQEKQAELDRLETKLKSQDQSRPFEPKGSIHQFSDLTLDQTDPESVYLKKLLEYEQHIMKEQEDKPLWSAGITEVEISQAARLDNIQKCEELLFQRLRSVIKSKLFKTENLLIPNEDIIAKGGIWAQPKRLRMPEDDVKKKIRKTLTSVFGKQRKSVAFEPNKKLKIE